MSQPYALERFKTAQAPVYDTVLRELEQGRKRSHWMWFIFPQLDGLGRSETARYYALSGLGEARAYLADPVLGERLRACCALLASLPGHDPHAIFGAPDDMKFHSSLTLFAQAAPELPVFSQCLQKYFAGAPDQATLTLLSTNKE
ncbi:DUF1810 domain-containing protein [Rugamonas apoptosis]|uniref:DUF1810 domain-containing protein n=1 Tax=Rugamonas apoptosis TaxID=2758570 RepID=A0A7W2IMA2_9BURK|nr:DUF1810 domain-containing protein [Rugamonas apoptosis]MBA5689297.1 DUF1810 domain-containing protein [Rugamonas apoptosis]